MAQEQDHPEVAAPAEADATSPGQPGDAEQSLVESSAGAAQPPWSQVWHLPLLITGLLLLGLSVYLSVPKRETRDYEAELRDVELFIKANNLEQAQERLRLIEPHLDDLTDAQQGRHWMYWGDVFYLHQRQHNVYTAERNKQIRQAYQRALDLGLSFDADHLRRLAETMVAMGDDAAALALLDQLKDQPAERRYTLVKQIIQRRLSTGGARVSPLLPMLGRFLEELREETNLSRRRAERIWAVALQADAILEEDNPEAAIQHLVREMIRFSDAGGDQDLSPLMIRLGQAFSRTGEYEEATRYFTLAQQRLDRNDPLHAYVLTGLGEVALAQSNDVAGALQLFTDAQTLYPDTDFAGEHHDIYLSAVIGRANCEALLENHSQALEHFADAVALLAQNPSPPPARVEQLVSAVLAQHGLSADGLDYQQALDYLTLLLPLYRGNPPADVLLKFAGTHRLLAQSMLGRAATPTGEEDLAGPTQTQRRALNRQAAVHFEKAGDFYLLHAAASTLDDQAHGQSLWNAAEAYDQAQMWKKAIDVWDQYVQTRATDPRQLEAMNRLGQAYLADGQFDNAVIQFENLVTHYSRTPEAYASLVPLARSYIELDRIDDAVRVLTGVTTDHESITPASEHYRGALIELGKLYYHRQQFVPAIERLTEAVERYGHTADGPLLRYRLADAYRRSVADLDQTLMQPLPQSKIVALRAQRAARLEQALDLFHQSIADLEAMPEASRSDLERLCLRNAYFYRADCAYDLGQYQRAIGLYDQAAKRWEHDPASLVALVQIVNAYCEMGRTQEARAANVRARDHLKRIPESAFEDKSLPMSRQHWQDWLRWTSELNLFAGAPPRRASVEEAMN